jgi:hypothetical protein
MYKTTGCRHFRGLYISSSQILRKHAHVLNYYTLQTIEIFGAYVFPRHFPGAHFFLTINRLSNKYAPFAVIMAVGKK